MPFPETPRVIFERNPLAEVICQLRFPTILRIASEPPADLQERLRPTYPVFRQEQPTLGVPAELTEMVGELPMQLRTDTNYAFETEDGARTVSLTREFLAISERRYVRWENLSAEIQAVK